MRRMQSLGQRAWLPQGDEAAAHLLGSHLGLIEGAHGQMSTRAEEKGQKCKSLETISDENNKNMREFNQDI